MATMTAEIRFRSKNQLKVRLKRLADKLSKGRQTPVYYQSLAREAVAQMVENRERELGLN